MRYIKALKLAPSEFKRMYGVTVETFWEMVKAVRDGKQGSRGSHASLPIPDQILLTLQYLREYRTYFHIAQDWGMHESTAQRTVKRIEDILIKSGKFGLPSRRKLWKDTAEIEVIAIDVASTEIERQKKTEKILQWEATVSHPEDTTVNKSRETRNYLYSPRDRKRTGFPNIQKQ